MRTSPAGIELIKEFEGCKLKAYLCPAGVLTIGVGHTGPDVTAYMVITEEQADELLRKDLEKTEKALTGFFFNYPVTQAQFDACVSLAFNIGHEAFRKSTVMRKIAEGDDVGAAEAFKLWNKGGGKVLPGLVRRREAEGELFLS